MKKLLTLLSLVLSFLGYGQLTQNFESGVFPPTGWTTFDNGIGTINWSTTSSTALAYGGTGTSAYLTRANGSSATTAEEYLVTSQVTVPANGQLRFYTRTTLAGDDGTSFSVRVSTTSQTGTGSFTTIPGATWTDNTLTTTYNIYEEKVISLSAYAGQNIYLAFVRTNENGDRWLIDNVNVVQTCNVPATLTSTNIGTTSALLGWTGPVGATQWQIEVVPQSANFTGVPNYTANTNPYTVTGLTQGTPYKFRVRAICPSGFPSDWSATATFTTTLPGQVCVAPIVIGSLPYTTTDNTANYGDPNDIIQPLTCSGSAANYMDGNDVFYSFTPSFTGNIAITLNPTVANSSIHVFATCPSPSAVCLAGVVNNTSNPRNINPFPVTAGTTYYIIISSLTGTQTVGYTLNIQQVFCTQPNALTATGITSTSATLSWGNPSGATSWEVSVAPAPYGLPVGAGTTVTTNTGWNFTGISGVVYQYYVRASCGDGTFSIWSGPFTFTLPQVAVALPYTDGFETLSGWTLSSGTQSNKWSFGTAVNNGGTHSMYISDSYGATNTYTLTSSSIVHAYKDFTIPAGFTQAELKFDWKALGESANDLLRVWVIPATTTPTAGTGLVASTSNIKVGNDLLLSSTWNNVFINDMNVAPYAGGTMRLVFEWRNNATLGSQPPAAIDNVELKLVTCPKPKNLASSNISYSQAQVSWVNGATETQWEVLVLPQGSAAPTATSSGTVVSTPSPYLITGLNSVTCYDVYVRAICSPTDKSYWSLPITICTTPNFCAGDHFTDTGGTTGGYQNNENYSVTACPGNIGDVVTVVFNSFNLAAGDNLIVRNGDLPTSPILGTYTGTTLPPSFTSTSPSGCLTFSFSSNATGTSTGWDAMIYCTPAITCPKPTNLQVSNITNNSAQFTWTEAGSATQWEIIVLPLGSPIPAPGTPGLLVNTNSYIFGPLNPGTAYTYFVRAKCSDTNYSFYSNGTNFYTKPINDECAGAINVPVNNDLNCTLVTPGVIIGATNSGLPASTCGGTADDDVWFSFTATSQAHIINLNDIVGTTTDLSHAVYSGTCGALTLKYCDVNNFSYNNTFVIGQTYYIRVWTATTALNQNVNFNVCINKVLPPIFAQNASTPTSPATYTVQQLVTDVLVTSPCGIVSNITYSTGTNYGQQNGIGYFNKNGSSFGLDEGIILATRSADTCDGPNTAGSEGTTTWPGDAQLLSYMQSVGQSVTNYYNSSKLEFDFVPIADQVKFDFIFASDEYGTFQCDYSDAFAFFLTNTTTGVTTNLAVIPGTTPPIPVAVTTIRKNQYNSSCASANPTFFDKFYGTGNPQNGLPDVVDPINFNGYTIPMSAVGNVIPGQTYHMKFVVGDRNDASYDSAVFLSKFDIGNVNLGNDLTVSSNNALCVGQSYTINSGLTAPPYEFTWYFRDSSSSSFVAIAGQTGPILSVTAPGEYKLVAHYVGSSCVGEDTVLVEFYPDLSLNTPEPNDLTICNSNPAFDLTQNTPIVLANFATPSNYQVTYYLTQADAMAGTNAITNPASYVPVSNPQTIWVRIFNTNSSCYGVKEFDLSTIALPTADISYDSTPYCYNAGVANVVFTGVTGGNYSVVGTPANIFVDNTGTVTWNNQVLPGSYTIKYEIGTGTCSANDTFTIQIDAPINASISGSTTICQGISTSVSFVGTPGAIVTYNDGNTNQTITLDAVGTASVNHVGGTKTYSLINVSQGSCIQSLTGSAVVSVVSIPQFTIPSNLTFCQNANNTLSVSPTNFNLSDVTYVWSFNTTTLPDVGSSITVNQSGTYSVTVTNSQGCSSTQTCVVNSIAMPTADVFTDVFVCDSYQLPALSGGNSYYTQPNGQGVQLFPGHLITSNQTVYVFAQTGTTPNCTDESSFDVTIVNSPQFTIVGGCEGSAFVVKAIIANPELYTFQWLDPSGAQVGTTSSVIANSPGIYTCNVTLTSGTLSCVTPVAATFDSVVCSIQKGISPNGDMKNDYLKLRAEKVEIFNRYGKEVYSKVNYDNDWYGQSNNGSSLSDGTYYYVIQLLGGETKSGWIYINKQD